MRSITIDSVPRRAPRQGRSPADRDLIWPDADGAPWVVEHRDAGVVTSRGTAAVVLQVTGSFPDVARTAHTALLRAVSYGLPAVACDLSAVTGQLDESTLQLLLDTDGHLEHWPGTRLALVDAHDRLRGLANATSAGQFSASTTVREALLALSATPRPSTARIHLDHHPRAPRTARDFVSRTCLDWQHPQVIGSAALVISELVTNGLVHAGTDLDVTISAVDGLLRLAVHDGIEEPPRMLPAPGRRGRGRGLHIVEGFSRAWGSLPGPGTGKVVWAVLGA